MIKFPLVIDLNKKTGECLVLYPHHLVLALVIFAGFIFGFYMVKPELKPIHQKSNFEVVDTYKGCEVVEWNKPTLAEYKYFIYCNKQLASRSK